MKQHCCISHEFLWIASAHPDKIAVIHASGGLQLFRELHGVGSRIAGNNISGDKADSFFKNRAINTTPPMYEGDQCFPYSHLLAAVDSLSSRLLSLLRRTDLKRENIRNGVPEKKARMAAEFSEASTELESTYTPKIIGIYMPPSVEYVIAVLSILRCGEAFMPLDPAWPRSRILSAISSSNVDLIIYSGSSFSDDASHRSDGLHWLVDNSGCSTCCYNIEENSTQEHKSPINLDFPCENGRGRLFSYVMYTSGSTGKPKGVCGTEQGLLNRFLWMKEIFPSSGEDLLLFKTSISFIDHIQEFLSAILTSSALVIPPLKEIKENLYSIVDFIQAYSINKLTAVPSLMRVVLPALRRLYEMQNGCSLRLLILSGEILPTTLWNALHTLLPETTILNLYGSTEVSGDCTYFDCKRMPTILETEAINTVPIGVPISHCDVVIVDDNDALNQGEVYVGGPCVCSGYYSDSTFLPLDATKFSENSIHGGLFNEKSSQVYIKTGDFAQRLQSGDLVFLGRRDRSIKVNGQRIALEEIEDTLRGHPNVVDAAVISNRGDRELEFIVAFLVLKDDKKKEEFKSSVRSWMVDKVPLAMIPNSFFFIDSIPRSSSGKVDYEFLAHSSSPTVHENIDDTWANDLLEVIKKVFSDALMVEEVSSNDDFFMMGGNSIAAAHVSHSLGVDMRWLYYYPSPVKLLTALVEKKGSDIMDINRDADWKKYLKADRWNKISSDDSEIPNHFDLKEGGSFGKREQILSNESFSRAVIPKNDSSIPQHSKVVSDFSDHSEVTNQVSEFSWNFLSKSMTCAFSRCNKAVYEGKYSGNNARAEILSVKVPRGESGSMKKSWQVHMESCVDASPLVVFKHSDIYLFIGSHSQKFVCVDAKSGSLQWETRLEGRIECSTAIVGDFSQVVVGCYNGKIYFLNFSTGIICWTFQTCGEVKSQPVVDLERNLIWCGSHDHNLYALDYMRHSCVYKLPCGGSLYGSPVIDEVQHKLYVASTSGRMSALLIKASPFNTLWHYDLGVPIFGSLSIDPLKRNVICCLVDGHVVALDSSGSVLWRCKTGGPIFAGACISSAIPSQVLICSRNGSIYSFELESGNLVWDYNIGNPITASACVDEHLQLVSEPSLLSDRLICVCSSSGTIHLLRVNLNKEAGSARTDVEEFARINLEGDIFSSPVMIGGRIFVGCRDDYVHCVVIGNLNSKNKEMRENLVRMRRGAVYKMEGSPSLL